MKSIFRFLFVGPAVAAASLLGTMDEAQAQSTMNFHANLTCQGTSFAAGIHYTEGTTTAIVYYSLDPDKAGQSEAGTGYEVITTPTGSITTSLQPVGFAIGNYANVVMSISGGTSPYNQSLDVQEAADNVAPGLSLNSPASYQQLFDYINVHGTPTTAYTSDNSPSFQINSITPIVCEPSAVHLTNTVVAGGQFKFSFNSVLGHTHAVRYRTDVHSGLWQTLTNIVGDGSFKTVQTPVTNAACVFQVVSQ